MLLQEAGMCSSTTVLANIAVDHGVRVLRNRRMLPRRRGTNGFMEQIQVWRGAHGDPAPLFGPLPGIRLGDTLAYEFQLPDSFVPWPGSTLLERVSVLLDLSVKISGRVQGWILRGGWAGEQVEAAHGVGGGEGADRAGRAGRRDPWGGGGSPQWG